VLLLLLVHLVLVLLALLQQAPLPLLVLLPALPLPLLQHLPLPLSALLAQFVPLLALPQPVQQLLLLPVLHSSHDPDHALLLWCYTCKRKPVDVKHPTPPPSPPSHHPPCPQLSHNCNRLHSCRNAVSN
jgi:hypothetical protein